MSSRKTTLFYSLLIMVASLAVGMVIALWLELTSASSAQTAAGSLAVASAATVARTRGD